MTIEARGPPDGLTRIVNEEVETLFGAIEMPRERFDTRRMAEIDSVDLEAIAEALEVRLARVAKRGVTRKARAHDDPRTRAKKENRRLVADLHARAADECHATAEIRALGALAVVEVAALGAHLVVEEVDARARRLAHVANARLGELRRVPRRLVRVGVRVSGIRERERHRSDVDGFETLPPNARSRELGFVGGAALALLLLAESAGEDALLGALGTRQAPRGGEQAVPRLEIEDG